MEEGKKLLAKHQIKSLRLHKVEPKFQELKIFHLRPPSLEQPLVAT